MFQCHSFTSGGRLDDPSSDYTKDSLSFESVSITQLLVHGAELCALKVTSLWEEGRAGHKAARARKKTHIDRDYTEAVMCTVMDNLKLGVN